MPSSIRYYIKKLLKHDNSWCRALEIYNPYIDPWTNFISKKVADFDYQAYKKYRLHNYVYDKLWVAQSQGVRCGLLENFSGDGVEYPIFIKPRWGHKSATSKNCFKIKNKNELKKYRHIPEMMWSEFYNNKEQMTDYFLLDGEIQHQVTYLYSDKQYGSIGDIWKFISPKSKPPREITEWVIKNMDGFTGPCNIQYRGNKIIEVSLRLARGGAYILNTKNDALIDNINYLVEDGIWYDKLDKEMNFEPFYSFKCISDIPLIYVYPQHFLDKLMKHYGCMEFYEYYFEPSGKYGSTIMQFNHSDFKQGMRAKHHIETLMTITQLLFVLSFLYVIVLAIRKSKEFKPIFTIIFILYFSKIINPLTVHYDLFKCQKQMIL